MSSLSNLLCTIKGMQNIKGTCRDKYTPELEKRNIFVKISKYIYSVYIPIGTLTNRKLVFAL